VTDLAIGIQRLVIAHWFSGVHDSPDPHASREQRAAMDQPR
jgi:hypothetical protein